MGIIATVAAITAAVVGHVKERARATVCVSNQRQLAVALNLYSPDHNDFLPLTSLGPKQINPMSWPELIEPYLRAKAVTLKCPSYASGPYIMQSTRASATGYGLNGCLLQGAPVVSSASTVLLAEAADVKQGLATEFGPNLHLWSPDSMWLESCQRFGGLEPCEVRGPLGSRRHFNRGNYCFVDTHVRSLFPEAIRVLRNLGKGTDPCPTSENSLTGSPGDPSFALAP